MAVASNVDESGIKSAHDGQNTSTENLTFELALAKARAVSQQYPYSYVLGADQICVGDNHRFDKPKDLNEAREHLKRLRGRSHKLVNGLVILKGSEVLWRHTETATLTMRDFSDSYLERYLIAVGEDVLSSVGGYRLELLGSQLFDAIEGDYFTILGLPLLPLLAYLRHIHILDD